MKIGDMEPDAEVHVLPTPVGGLQTSNKFGSMSFDALHDYFNRVANESGDLEDGLRASAGVESIETPRSTASTLFYSPREVSQVGRRCNF